MEPKELCITRVTVMKAYGEVIEQDGIVNGLKTLEIFGASYLYPIFVKWGS